jgi:hypothetical protein
MDYMDDLVARARAIDPQDSITKLSKAIKGYEEQYKLTTEALIAELDAGTRYETFEVCQWLMLAGLRQRLLCRTTY